MLTKACARSPAPLTTFPFTMTSNAPVFRKLPVTVFRMNLEQDGGRVDCLAFECLLTLSTASTERGPATPNTQSTKQSRATTVPLTRP